MINGLEAIQSRRQWLYVAANDSLVCVKKYWTAGAKNLLSWMEDEEGLGRQVYRNRHLMSRYDGAT